MASPIIEVERIGKRYSLHHAIQPRGSLREALAYTARRLFGSRPVAGTSVPEQEDFWALRDVTFDVKPGEIVGIIGRNGAGKSTLLKVLSRITEPTTGRIRLRGRIASLLEVGTGFHPELTGRENIFLNGAILGMSKGEIRNKFEEIVSFAEVEKFLDTAVKHYSSGMYVRLAFAVAAHLEPEILVVDEVLAVGDAQFQKKCLGKLGSVSIDQGRTVLLVSHQLNVIESVCTRCIMLNRGSVEVDSTDIRSVTTHYLGAAAAATSETWIRASSRYDNPYFAPQKLELVSPTGLASPYPRNATLNIRLIGDVETTDRSLSLGYELYNEQNESIYCSFHTDGPETSWPQLTTGTNVLTTTLPQWLNEGKYRLALTGGLYCRTWLFPPDTDVPSITFDIRGGLSASPYWQTRRRGAIGPILDWNKE